MKGEIVMIKLTDPFPMEKAELYSSMSIPSTVHSYSIAVEFMKKWFLEKFNSNYFKTIHVEGKHVLDDFRDFDITKNLKKLKPSVAIIPQMEFEFNRDNVDLYPFGITQHLRRSKLESSFFKDSKRNMYIGVSLEALQVNFTYKIRVSSRPQQIDLYKYLQMAFRIGSTQGHQVDIDYHIPYSLMLQVAKDARFEIIENKIINIIDFVSYLNSHSQIPILFKLRTINGNSEFFLRFKDVYMHIDCQNNLSADDGEKEGMIYSNFVIDLNVTLKMPTPKMYQYYSIESHDYIENIESSDTANVGLSTIKLTKIPERNSKGWETYLTTDYYEEDTNNPLVIEFEELFKTSDLEKVINHTKSIFLSPMICVDFKIFNNGDEIKYTIDWNTMTIRTEKPVSDKTSTIAVYVDLAYMTQELITIDNSYSDRIRGK